MKYNLLLILTYIIEVLYSIVGIIHEDMHDLLVKCFELKQKEANRRRKEDIFL